MSTKLTKWFPADAEPVRKGVYQRRLSREVFAYSIWDGAQWLFGRPTVAGAAAMAGPTLHPSAPWRGLAHPPEKA